jgi:hypothetical protein
MGGDMKNRWTFILVTILLVLSACTRSIKNATAIPGVLPLPSTATATFLMDSHPTATPAISPTSPEPTATVTQAVVSQKYAVLLLGEGDLLNVRAGPGTENDILITLPPDARDLPYTGNHQGEGESSWVEIQLQDGTSGWVSGYFVTEQVASDQFCQDGRVVSLLDRFSQAINNQEGGELAAISSPTHGLIVQLNWWNPAVEFNSAEVIKNLFISTTSYDWGVADGSGIPVTGSFKDNVLPVLGDITTREHTSICNVLESGVSAGGTAGLLTWPVEYQNLNYVALYRAAPEEQEFDWRTWVVGIEYVDGVPYIAVLIQYNWEI